MRLIFLALFSFNIFAQDSESASDVEEVVTVGSQIRLTANSFTFTCDYNGDGQTTQKTYPRASGEAVSYTHLTLPTKRIV